MYVLMKVILHQNFVSFNTTVCFLWIILYKQIFYILNLSVFCLSFTWFFSFFFLISQVASPFPWENREESNRFVRFYIHVQKIHIFCHHDVVVFPLLTPTTIGLSGSFCGWIIVFVITLYNISLIRKFCYWLCSFSSFCYEEKGSFCSFPIHQRYFFPVLKCFSVWIFSFHQYSITFTANYSPANHF